MTTQKKQETRKDYLLRVCIAFIKDNQLEENTTRYDGAKCDGSCLIEDIEIELDY